ncbi:MAG: hypothetical protein Q4D14_05805 [Bacteroidales bacterium]|nr:hypothetical protein [Bacteroidales bacterium]
MKQRTLTILLLLIIVKVFAMANTENLTTTNDKLRKNAIKVTFLSLFTGSTKLTYERAIGQFQSNEITVGMIGAGYDGKHNKPLGVTARYAHKFIFAGNNTYALNGWYAKPELIYSYFHYNPQDGSPRTYSSMGTIMGLIGYQWAKHLFTIDGFFGLGYAFGKEADTYYEHGFALWNYVGTKNRNLSICFGAKIGLAFGK